jgi:hypothetical protein
MLLSLLKKNADTKVIFPEAINTVSVSEESIKVEEEYIRLLPPA